MLKKKFFKSLAILMAFILPMCIMGDYIIASNEATKETAAKSDYSGDSDYQLLARIISAEARGEPYEGQVAVGAVVLNRIEHPSFPDTMAGVIYQPLAFSAVDDGQIDAKITESCYRAATDALNGWDPSGGALYYYNPVTATSKWIRSRVVIKQIGKHLFCE